MLSMLCMNLAVVNDLHELAAVVEPAAVKSLLELAVENLAAWHCNGIYVVVMESGKDCKGNEVRFCFIYADSAKILLKIIHIESYYIRPYW